MAAIIVPAHNESTVIEQSLTALLRQAGEADEVIVVCNGCTDDTAEISRRFAPRVTVLTTPAPSKVAALNLGDQHARTFPRVYMDADVVLEDGALEKLTQVLVSGRLLAASPAPVMAFSGCNWAVRAYYDIWLSLPYCRAGMMGAGLYALSEAGRQRFETFPDLIADDGYVRALFKEHERGSVAGAQCIVHAPVDLGWLIRIKTRSRLGALQLHARFPGLRSNEAKDYSGALREVMLRPSKWPEAAVYLYVNLMSRFLAKRQIAHLAGYRWEKDLSSRHGRQR